MRDYPYRVAYRVEHGDGPWLCTFCESELQTLEVVHHIDGDRSNGHISNLAAAHEGCHHRHHSLGRTMSEASKKKISLANTGRQRTPEQKARISEGARRGLAAMSDGARADMVRRQVAGTTGKKRTQKTKDQISTANSGRVFPKVLCSDCGREWAGAWVIRHKDAGKCV